LSELVFFVLFFLFCFFGSVIIYGPDGGGAVVLNVAGERSDVRMHETDFTVFMTLHVRNVEYVLRARRLYQPRSACLFFLCCTVGRIIQTCFPSVALGVR